MLILGDVVVLAIYPQPDPIIDWFALFQSNSIVGLLDLWGLEVPMYLMFILMYLTLYIVLRKANQSLMVIALTFALLLSNTSQRAVGGFNTGLFLVSVAGLMVSSVMLQSNSFSRSIAFVGILAHALSLADYLRQALTPSAIVALLVILPNALFLVIWYVLVGRRLYQMGRPEGKMFPKQS